LVSDILISVPSVRPVLCSHSFGYCVCLGLWIMWFLCLLVFRLKWKCDKTGLLNTRNRYDLKAILHGS
jgi:hypothetical protein